jgi:hypothetical protein
MHFKILIHLLLKIIKVVKFDVLEFKVTDISRSEKSYDNASKQIQLSNNIRTEREIEPNRTLILNNNSTASSSLPSENCFFSLKKLDDISSNQNQLTNTIRKGKREIELNYAIEWFSFWTYKTDTLPSEW